MGILNLTPDSFSDGGKFNDEKSALIQVEKMLSEGANIIDIGAQSTRPNANYLNDNEEINRLKNILPAIRKEFSHAILSLDTFHSEVVNFGYNEGIDIVNDISAGQFDEKMFPMVSETGLPYILTHGNSSYETMHQKNNYEDIILEINRFFSKKITELLDLGVKDIILDPGFGFGKSIEDQYKMTDELEHILFGKYPLLIGISRKSFIYKPLNKSPHEINEETQNLHLKMLKKGAKILRVHNVAETKKTIENFLSL
ncbi:MAG: dihydropteroate synthase [Flavobacteriaceae bacterium]|nr:dihydropteroate synthase [Flavobacteriaceae bacterium]